MWGGVPGLVAYASERFGFNDAIVDGDVRIAYEELADRCLELTRAVLGTGVGAGDRVALWAPNMAEWVLTALAVLGAGATLVPLNTRFKGEEAAFVLRRSRARMLFTVRGFLGNDYPAMLEGEELPDLERIVLLRDADGPPSLAAATAEVPVFAWTEFLRCIDGVVEGDGGHVGVPVSDHAARNRWQ